MEYLTEAARSKAERIEAALDDPATALAPEPGGKWEFNAKVAAAFDDMLARSIPNYAHMREMVTRAACWHLDRLSQAYRSPQRLVDLGASRGAAVAPILEAQGARTRYLLYDVSEPMLAACRERFAEWIDQKIVKVEDHDLRASVPGGNGVAVYLSVLTLQFVPIEYRQRILTEIASQLRPGGALILVEKVLGATAELDRVEVDLYHDTKLGAGYTQEAIERKRLSLEGVLVPLTASFNEQLMRDAGFAGVDCVWAWANFRCWVAAAPRDRRWP